MKLGRIVAAHNILYDLHAELSKSKQDGASDAAELVAGALVVTEQIIRSTAPDIAEIPNTEKIVEAPTTRFTLG